MIQDTIPDSFKLDATSVASDERKRAVNSKSYTSTDSYAYATRFSPMRVVRIGAVVIGVLALALLVMHKPASAAARTASVSGNWNNTATWGGASVPVAGDTVTINSGVTVTVTADAACDSIDFLAAATTDSTVTINAGIVLTVSGAITIPRQGTNDNTMAVGAGILNAGSIAFTNGGGGQRHHLTISTGTVTVSGNVTQSGSTGSATITFTGAGLLQLGGTFLTAATATFTPSTGTVQYNAAGAQTVGDFTYNNLTLSGSGTKTLGGATTVNTTATIDSGVTFSPAGNTLSLSSATLNVNGTLDFSNASGSVTSTAATSVLTMGSAGLIRTIDGTGLGPAAGASLIASSAFTTTSIDTNGTVEYYGAAQTVTDRNYNNLTITNAGTKTWTRTATTRTVNGDVTINASAPFTLAGAFAVNVLGDWTNGGTFTTTTGTVVFNGSAAQTIAGANASAFSGLTINNSAGVTMDTSGSVGAGNGVLTLTTDLTVTDPAILTHTGTGTPTGAGDVVGTVRRTDVGATTRSFGNVNVQITNAGTATQVDVFLVKGTAPSGFAQAVLRTYTLTPGAGTINATLRLRYLDTELNGNAEGSLTLWRETAGVWADQSFNTRDGAANWVQKTTVTGFSSWTLASAPSAPTAVKLNRFQAFAYSDGVALTWNSGDEINNLGYYIYRDDNGRRVRVTPSVVAGSALRVGPGMRMAAGFSYAWFDANGSAKTGYYLEAIDLDGTRQTFGPIYPSGEKGLSPRGQRAMLVNELNAAARSNGNSAVQTGWAASLSKAGRSETFRLTTDGLSRQHEIAAGAAVKVAVNRSGWYRLTQPELLAAGLNPSTDVRFLQMYVDGEEIPIRLNSNGPTLSANDSIEFFGVALDTPSTDTRTYWLVTGDSFGQRISGPKRSKNKGDVEWTHSGAPGSFLYTAEVRERISYFPNLLNGETENIFGPLVTDVPTTQTLQVRNLDQQTGNAQLSIAMQGASAHQHAVEVQLNGVLLGTISFAGQQNVVTDFTVNRTLLTEGANTLRFTAVNGEIDLLFVDWARLTYARQYRAVDNSLQFGLDSGRTARISGFSSANVRVFDVSDPNNVAEVDAQVAQFGSSYSATVRANGGGARTFVALAENAVETQATLRANQPSRWNDSVNGADMVIISHGDFRQAVEPLAAHRRNQGLAVSVVDVEDVYDEFGYGAHSPVAIKAFLSWAASHWTRAPRYLLLVGDSSWDPRNYTGEGEFDFVPTRMLDTSHMETASDDWLADFNGDELADMAVGRLPARTAADAALMTAKIIAYEQSLGQNGENRGAVMVADNGFEGQSAQTAALLPQGMTIQSINRSTVGNDDVARSQILTALNDGPSVVNFYGHGSVTVWTGAGLLDNDLASGLTNTNKLSLFVMMTCLNGYSHEVYTDTLGEAALKAQNGGAVAVWASSGFTQPQPQFEMDSEFYRQLFGSETLRLGEAARNAKAAVSDLDVRRTWILLGDPAMRIR